MAITYVNAGAGANGAANCTPALPASIVTGDLLIAVVEGANQAPAIGAQNGGAWATVAAHTGTGVAGGTTATGITLYWDRYNGTQTAPNFTDGGGDHVGARIYAFRGVKSTGNPWNAVQTSVDATSDTSLSATGITTTVNNSWVIIAATLMDDAQDFGATWTNADLTSITVRDASYGHAAGNDGRLILVTGEDAVAGTVTATTNTITANSVKAMVVMDLEPAPAASFDQIAWRGRNDNGDETTATWKALQNTDFSQAVSTPFRLRLRVDETAGASPGVQVIGQLQYNKNGGGWNNVTAASANVQSVASGTVSNGTATTEQLTGGTGTFHAGEFDSNNGIAHLGSTTYAAGDVVESEWCMQIIAADVADGDTIDFKVTRTVGGDLDAYSQVPTVTVVETAGSTATAGVGTINVQGVAGSPASGMVTLTGGVGTVNVQGVAAAAADSGMVTVAGGVGTINIQGVAAASALSSSWTQAGYRGRNDDGNETTATWKAAENTGWSQDVDTNFRTRFVVDETNGVAAAGQQRYHIQYNLNAAGWNDVTNASSVVRAFSSPNVANGTATTRQLSSGTGSFTVGEVDADNGVATGNFPAAGDLTEVEYCVQIIGADVVNADSIQLRVKHGATSTPPSVPLDAYSQTPTITVSEGGVTAAAGVGSINVQGVAGSPASGMVTLAGGVGTVNVQGVAGSPASGMVTVIAGVGAVNLVGVASPTVTAMEFVTAAPGSIFIQGVAATLPVVAETALAGVGTIWIVPVAGDPRRWIVVGPSIRQRRIQV